MNTHSNSGGRGDNEWEDRTTRAARTTGERATLTDEATVAAEVPVAGHISAVVALLVSHTDIVNDVGGGDAANDTVAVLDAVNDTVGVTEGDASDRGS